jgi:peptidoglycan hydrolase-like protein with peptidoglycan-binding domain
MANEKDYIPRMVGLSQGDQGEEIERLQAYLEKFGYLQSPVLETFGIRAMRAVPPTARRGMFDTATTEALRLFQEFNHLPVTRVLDEATRDLMNRPRCGFPDIAEFANTGRKWPTTNLTYGFQEFTSDLSQAQVFQAIEQAFALWSAVTPLTFTRVALSSNPQIIIRYVTGDHGDGNAFDGPSGILAHAFYPPTPPNPPQPIQGDAHFDDAETWTITVPPATGTIDLVSVAAHEFGHSLGLGHSLETGALMYAFYGGPHRFLHSDDIAGIQTIYGGSPIAYAMWVHGTSIEVELPGQIETMQRFGFFTRIVGRPNTTNWIHFAIPTTVIAENDRKVIGSVMLRFVTGAQAVVRDVHIYDGEVRIAAHDGVNLSGNHGLERFGVANTPEVRWGVGISVGVTFTGGSADDRRMDFISAGCDFRP